MFLENFDFVLKGHLSKRTQNGGFCMSRNFLIWEVNSKCQLYNQRNWKLGCSFDVTRRKGPFTCDDSDSVFFVVTIGLHGNKWIIHIATCDSDGNVKDEWVPYAIHCDCDSDQKIKKKRLSQSSCERTLKCSSFCC